MSSDANGGGRTNQKTRTRIAIIEACRSLIRDGESVTMPEVARVALISEATAYRYFPDLASLINAALVGLWPRPDEALRSIASSTDPVERIALACDVFLRRVLSYQGSVRAMISATITRLRGRRQPAPYPVCLDRLCSGSMEEGAHTGRGRGLRPAEARPGGGDEPGGDLHSDRPVRAG